jgi:hypothetical protein
MMTKREFALASLLGFIVILAVVVKGIEFFSAR